MRKRRKLLAGAAVIVVLGAAVFWGYRQFQAAERFRRVTTARSNAENAQRAADSALAGLSFDDGTGVLLPVQIGVLEDSKRQLADSLLVERRTLGRGYELAHSPKPEDALWAFEAAQRGFQSVTDACRRLQARANELRQRGRQAKEKVDLAVRERDSTRRALAEVEQSDVGLPGKGKLRLDESRALLAQGEAKLETAKALLAGSEKTGSAAAYDAAEEACRLFDHARGAAQERSGLALEYGRVRLGEARQAQQAFEKAVREAEDAIRKLRGASGKQDLSAAQAQLQRARERGGEAEKMIAESRRRFEAQDFEGATKLLDTAKDIMDEATSLAEGPGRLRAKQGM